MVQRGARATRAVPSSRHDVDTVVIGSGAGGLTAAVALANAGERVLVCEQHYVAGGWCHSFTLEGHRFSPGVHYIGELGPGGAMRAAYEGLGVSRDLVFCELNPDAIDHIVVGDRRFDVPKGAEAFEERLEEAFPHERDGIRRYLAITRAALRGVGAIGRRPRTIREAIAAARDVATLAGWYPRSAQRLVDACIGDPVLKAVLLGQTGDHGVPPSRVSSVVHASVAHHYEAGGYYPLGGAFTLPRAFARALTRKGSTLRLRTRVARILVERGRAIGVRLEDGTEVRARNVVSNADPGVTFGRLVGPEHLGPLLRMRLRRTTYSTSALSLFLAVDMDLRAAGLDSGNVWFYGHPDVDRIYRQGTTAHNLGPSPIDGLFLTATTLKDPSKMRGGHHTLEAFAFVGYDAFRRWERDHASEGQPKRPDYAAEKQRLLEKMLDAVERVVPGIRAHVIFADLGTPLTNRYYLEATRGNLYGIDKLPFQVGPFGFPVRTPIDGLYMVGASTESHGVAGVTWSGLDAAGAILGCARRELLAERGPELLVVPSERPDLWPDRLRARMDRTGRSQPTSA